MIKEYYILDNSPIIIELKRLISFNYNSDNVDSISEVNKNYILKNIDNNDYKELIKYIWELLEEKLKYPVILINNQSKPNTNTTLDKSYSLAVNLADSEICQIEKIEKYSKIKINKRHLSFN